MTVDESRSFREICQENGIAVTHQRQVLYEVMKSMHGHPSPEEVYAKVKKKVPAISKCKAITDIGEEELGLVAKRNKLPGGFLVERYAVDVIGVCAKCQTA